MLARIVGRRVIGDFRALSEPGVEFPAGLGVGKGLRMSRTERREIFNKQLDVQQCYRQLLVRMIVRMATIEKIDFFGRKLQCSSHVLDLKVLLAFVDSA